MATDKNFWLKGNIFYFSFLIFNLTYLFGRNRAAFIVDTVITIGGISEVSGSFIAEIPSYGKVKHEQLYNYRPEFKNFIGDEKKMAVFVKNK